MKSIKNNSLISFLFMCASCGAFLILITAYISDYSWLLKAVPIAIIALFFFRKKMSLAYIMTIEKTDTGYYIASIAALVPLAVFFAYRCSRVGILYTVAEKLSISVNTLGTITGIALSAASYSFLLFCIKYFFRDFLCLNKDQLKKYKFVIKPSVILAVIYCLSIFTVIRSNFVYKDDMQRIVNGTTVYTREGRYLAEYVTTSLETTSFFADISPIPQILEMIIMAICSVLVWHWITDKTKADFFDIVAMSSFTLTPYFLECVSFKWDSPQHACAVFFAIVPLFFYKSGIKKYCIVTAVSIIAMCSFHQVPMGLFPSLVIAKAFLDWTGARKKTKDISVYLGQSALGYIAGLLIYRFLLMKDIVRSAGSSNTSVFPAGQIISGVIGNFKLFFGQVFSDFDTLWLILIAVIIVGFFVITVRESKQNKIKALAGSLTAFLLLTSLSFGLFPLLENPLYYPRHLYSICFYIGILCIITVCAFDVKGIITKSSAVVLAVCFFMFSIKYGNALYYQEQYVRFRTEMVANRLAETETLKNNEITYLDIVGDIGYCPEIAAIGSNMINKLVPTMFGEYYANWHAAGLYNQYGLRIHYADESSMGCTKDDMDVIYENYYYTLYAKDNNIIVELYERNDCLWVD